MIANKIEENLNCETIEIKQLCPNPKADEGMNIVFESYSDKLVTKEQDIDNLINNL